MVWYLRKTTSSGDAFGRDLLPQSGIGSQNTTRLPDWLALEVGSNIQNEKNMSSHLKCTKCTVSPWFQVLAYMPEHGGAMFVCRAWAEICLQLDEISHSSICETKLVVNGKGVLLCSWLWAKEQQMVGPCVPSIA